MVSLTSGFSVFLYVNCKVLGLGKVLLLLYGMEWNVSLGEGDVVGVFVVSDYGGTE